MSKTGAISKQSAINKYQQQCYNRYSYCLNNPLKYIDPTGHGEEIGTTVIDGKTYQVVFDGNGNYHLEAPGEATGALQLSDLLGMTSSYMAEVGDYGEGGNKNIGPVIKIDVQDPVLSYQPIPVYFLPNSHPYAQSIISQGFWGKTIAYNWFGLFRSGGCNIAYEMFTTSIGIENTVRHECFHYFEQMSQGLGFYIGYGLEYLSNLIAYKDSFLAYWNLSYEIRARAYEAGTLEVTWKPLGSGGPWQSLQEIMREKLRVK